MFLCTNINFIVICSLTNFNKNRTNNWKSTKLWGNDCQSIFVCQCINMDFIIICSLTNFDKNRTNNWKNTKLWGTHYQYLNNPGPKFPCLRHFGSWVIRLNVSMYKHRTRRPLISTLTLIFWEQLGLWQIWCHQRVVCAQVGTVGIKESALQEK